MSDYVDRMKQEHKELSVKVEALGVFIHANDVFKTLCDLEQVKMIKQLGYMESYLTVLGSRIWTAK